MHAAGGPGSNGDKAMNVRSHVLCLLLLQFYIC